MMSYLIEVAVDEEEGDMYANCFYFKSGVLMRKWRPPDTPAVLHKGWYKITIF